jgi:ERCC4-type nuclease
MELVADDRERGVIDFLKTYKDIFSTDPADPVKSTVFRVERLTVGDYVFIYNGTLIVIVERKSLKDLAQSIKDGRINNHDKLLKAQQKLGCKLIYLIEGCAFPSLSRCFCGIPFKALQGKIDSLQFNNDVRIIYTKNCEHTAERLRGLMFTFERMYKKGTFRQTIKQGGECGLKEVKCKHEKTIDSTHIDMISSIKGVSRAMAITILKEYSLCSLLNGAADENKCYNMVYPSGKCKLATRGVKLCRKLRSLDVYDHRRILSAINGITDVTAEKILNKITFDKIANVSFKKGEIANIKKSEKRRVGKSIEKSIGLVFGNID